MIKQAIIWLLALVTLGSVALLQTSGLPDVGLFQVETNLLQLLPSVDRQPIVERARTKLAESVERRLLFMVSADSAKQVVSAGVQLQQALENSGFLTLLDQQQLQQQGQDHYRDLYPYRYQLLSDDVVNQLENDPQQFVKRSMELLYSPAGFSRAKSLERDPLYLFGDYFEQFYPASVTVENGVILSATGDRHYGLIAAEVRQAAFDLKQQAQLLQLVGDLHTNHFGSASGVALSITGLPLYAASGASSAQSEIRLVGAGSLLGIILLLVATFGSVRPLLLALLAVTVGIFSAWLVSSLLFTRVHILTLVFGASLVGVAVDYCMHYFCCHLGTDDKNDAAIAEKRRQVIRGMTLALITSTVAYLSLASAPFPGLRQMAVFSATGLLFAWFTVVMLFPLLLKGYRWRKRQRLLQVVGNLRTVWLSCCIRYKWLGILTLLVLVSGTARLSSEDDIRQLQTPDSQLLRQEQHIKAVSPEVYDSRFWVVTGDSTDNVLQRERQLVTQLEIMQKQGGIAGYRALSAIIPDMERQQANYHLLRSNLYENGLITSYLKTLSFAAEHIERERNHFETSSQKESLLSTGLLTTALWAAPESWASLWLGCENGQCGSVVRLLGVSDTKKLAKLTQLPGVFMVNTVAETSALMAQYRERALWLLTGGIVLAILLLSLWLGRLPSLLAVAVPVVAIAITLGVLGWLGESLNLFRVFALLLVLGIGADFGIFSIRQQSQLSHTALAICLSAITTILAFGLLSLSDTAAVKSFGQTLLIGIVASLLLAPLVSNSEPRVRASN